MGIARPYEFMQLFRNVFELIGWYLRTFTSQDIPLNFGFKSITALMPAIFSGTILIQMYNLKTSV